jgi:hypothetical protein
VAAALLCVQALIAAGADMNKQNKDGHTALMFAYNSRTQVYINTHKTTQHIMRSSHTICAASVTPRYWHLFHTYLADTIAKYIIITIY